MSRNPHCPVRSYDAWRTWTPCQDGPDGCDTCDSTGTVECECCEGEGSRPFPMVTADWREAWTECHACDTEGTVDCEDCAEAREEMAIARDARDAWMED